MSQKSRFTAAEKREALAVVERTQRRTGWTIRRILKHLGLPKARYYDWRNRAEEDRLADARSVGICPWAILPEEREAAIEFALAHPRDGYRRLCWQAVDEEVVCMSPSSFYRVLDDADLLYRWKRSRKRGDPPPEPTEPNERWHTGLMYLRVADVWCFLVTVLDAYSRYVVHWELLSSMTANDVRLVVQQAVEKTGADPEVVTDNGSQFTSKDFKEMVRLFELEHIRIRTYHPESNGRLERFHRSTRDALSEVDWENLSRAGVLIGQWVDHYNRNRRHAALHYLPPAEYYETEGDPEARIAERKEKLARARKHREQINRERLQAAAYALEKCCIFRGPKSRKGCETLHLSVPCNPPPMIRW